MTGRRRRRRPPTPPKARHGHVHHPVEDPNAPGCCATCHRPLDAPNDRHQVPPVDPDVTAHEHRRYGETGDD